MIYFISIITFYLERNHIRINSMGLLSGFLSKNYKIKIIIAKLLLITFQNIVNIFKKSY
jgi:hypothetical protein